MKHEVFGVTISVTESDQSDITEHEVTPSQSCTVTVHGLCYIDKDDAIECLKLYFGQNKERSGGGEIAKGGIQLMKGKGIITFVDNKGLWSIVEAYVRIF